MVSHSKNKYEGMLMSSNFSKEAFGQCFICCIFFFLHTPNFTVVYSAFGAMEAWRLLHFCCAAVATKPHVGYVHRVA